MKLGHIVKREKKKGKWKWKVELGSWGLGFSECDGALRKKGWLRDKGELAGSGKHADALRARGSHG